MNLLGSRVLITGGTSGLGLAIARLLVDKGAHVWACGHSSSSVQEAHSVLPVSTFHPQQCDIADYTQVQELIAHIEHLDIVINCAGMYLEGKIEDQDIARIHEVVETNLLGLIHVTKAVLPGMKERNTGVMINVSSTAGLKPKYLQAVYAATKYAVRGFTESLKMELVGTNVDAWAVYPGKMNTQLQKKAGYYKDTSSWMDPNEVAQVILFMLERPSSMRMDKVVVKPRNVASTPIPQ